jgi:hypothetical protein
MQEKTYIDINQIYSELKQRGISTVTKRCCGRSGGRTDYETMLRILGKKGSFVIKRNNVVVGIVNI